MTVSGTSAYTISKLAAQRYMEFVATGTYLKFLGYDYKSAMERANFRLKSIPLSERSP
jgi:hypothetical protein